MVLMILQLVHCFESAWTEQTQGHPFFQPPATLQPLFQSWPLEPSSQPSSASGTSQYHLLSLAPYCWATMSSQMHQNYSTEVEAAISRLVNVHLQASYAFLSLGFYFDHEDLALEGVDHFFWELAEEKKWGQAASFEYAKPAQGCALFQDMQKLFQNEWDKAMDSMESTWSWGRTWSRPSWICMSWIPLTETLISVASWRTAWVSRQKSSRRWWPPGELHRLGPQAGLDEYPLERLTLKHTQEPQEPSRLWGASWHPPQCQGFCLRLPLQAAF